MNTIMITSDRGEGQPAAGESDKLSISARISALHARAGDQVQPMGAAPLPNGPQYFPQSAGTPWDWVVLRLVDDPRYVAGQLDMPRPVKKDLLHLADAGVEFDDLLIAHEVTKGAISSPKPTLAEVSKAINATPPRRHAVHEQLHSTLTAVLTGLKYGAGGLAAAPLAGLAPLGLLGVLADPALIGVLTCDGTPTPGQDAAYFLIARW